MTDLPTTVAGMERDTQAWREAREELREECEREERMDAAIKQWADWPEFKSS